MTMTHKERKIIAQAILNELEGIEYYRMAKQIADPETAQTLEYLAQEEEEHVAFLERLGKELEAGGEVVIDDEIINRAESPDIFNFSQLDTAHLALGVTVFGTAMEMERKSIAFYREARDQFEKEDSRRVIDKLIEWEKGHLERFTRQYEMYRREWWAEQGFTPY